MIATHDQNKMLYNKVFLYKFYRFVDVYVVKYHANHYFVISQAAKYTFILYALRLRQKKIMPVKI